MEELYRQIASQPPSDTEEQHKKALEPGPEDMALVEDAVRTTFECTEDDAWWETNAAEWERMAENPAGSFAVGGEDEADGDGADEWGMEDYFGEETPAWKPSDEARYYRLSAYKAGVARFGGVGAAGGGRLGIRSGSSSSGSSINTEEEASEVLALTPFGQYWESVPDPGTTGRVYAYNAVDRMGALKFMMNFTCNGMHGSPEGLQVGR